jgi:predicted helicase
MPRQGEDFNKLVAYLERAVADQPNVTIETNKRIPDKVTGGLREHDIVLTQSLPQRVTVTAIECRDRTRPVTVNQVEEFHAKSQHTGIDKRVIVSSTGFYKPARKKADFYGIDCLTFAQVENVDWFDQREMIFRKREVRHADIGIGAPVSMQGKRRQALSLHYRRTG